MNKITVDELVEKLGFTKDETTALVRYRHKSGDFREWGDTLVTYGVEAREMEAARAKVNFYAKYTKPGEFTGIQWFLKKKRNT